MEKTAFIIVTYNNESNIGRCLRSLQDFSAEIIVVDNSSEDKTLFEVERFKKVKLIKSDKNLGFAKGCNLAVKNTEADILIFLNPDTIIRSKNFMRKVLEDLNEEKVGIVGPKFVHPDGSMQKTVRNFPTPWNAFKEYLLGQKGAYDFYELGQKSEVDVVVGGCLAIRSGVFRKVKGFNEKFFLYFEDIELCKKIKSIGYKIIYDPDILIEHIEGASGKGKNVSKLLVESAKRYHGLMEYYLITMIIQLGQKVRG